VAKNSDWNELCNSSKVATLITRNFPAVGLVGELVDGEVDGLVDGAVGLVDGLVDGEVDGLVDGVVGLVDGEVEGFVEGPVSSF
jgi:hypothetical protein